MKHIADRVAPRFFAPVKLSPGVEIELPERAARHCAVLRLRRGETVILFTFALLYIAAAGGGAWSADKMWRGTKD